METTEFDAALGQFCYGIHVGFSFCASTGKDQASNAKQASSSYAYGACVYGSTVEPW
jgi:hypothetical protein